MKKHETRAAKTRAAHDKAERAATTNSLTYLRDARERYRVALNEAFNADCTPQTVKVAREALARVVRAENRQRDLDHAAYNAQLEMTHANIVLTFERMIARNLHGDGNLPYDLNA